MAKILVVAVHPDDEVLGCGGTLLKHKANGDAICRLIVTSVSEKCGFSSDFVKQRKQEIKITSQMFGFSGDYEVEFPTTMLDSISIKDIVASISDVFSKIKPDIVYLPFKNDVHTDHQVVFRAAYSCTKIFRHPTIKKIAMMETISESEFACSTMDEAFIPNMFVCVTDFMEEKIKIMKVYQSELGVHPFPRSEKNIRALASFRGATAGCEYAESFVILKEII